MWITVRKAIGPAAILCAALMGCANDTNQETANLTHTGTSGSSAAPNPRPAPEENARVAAAEPEKQPATTSTTTTKTSSSTDDRQRVSYAYPTGHNETSVLLIERDLPHEVYAGQEFYYDIKVTNLTHVVAKDVVVRDECAGGMTIVRTEPMPASKDLPLTWNVGDLKPNESRNVHVVAKTTATEPFTSCASATYNQTLCLSAPVVKASLKLTLAAPADATPCDPIPLKLTVLNNGAGTLRNVQLAYPLPQGWTTADGKATEFRIDALEPNQSREFAVSAKAPKIGEFSSKATATVGSGMKVESAPVTTTVRQPVLAIKAEAPENAYAQTPITLKYSITNSGNAPVNNATLDAQLPANVKMVSASDGGSLQGNTVTWKLEPFAAKASRTVSLAVEAGAIGGVDIVGTARASCADPVTASTSLSISGIAALLLQVKDLVDPVLVNNDTTYEIVVTNQGSAPATNVKIVAMLEDNENFLSATGGKASVDDNKITFETITSLAPKAAATMRLTVKCVKEGDVRFRVSMTSDQLTRPVDESESTRVYR